MNKYIILAGVFIVLGIVTAVYTKGAHDASNKATIVQAKATNKGRVNYDKTKNKVLRLPDTDIDRELECDWMRDYHPKC